MGDTIKLKKGLKAKLPTLGLAEPGFVTDEEKLYIGGVNGNVAIPNQKDINDLNTKIQTNKTEIDNEIADVKNDMNNAKYTDELTQESDIFSIGKGKNALGQDVDVSQSVVNGQLSSTKIEGKTYTNLYSKSLPIVAVGDAKIVNKGDYFEVSGTSQKTATTIKVKPNTNYTVKNLNSNTLTCITDGVSGSNIIYNYTSKQTYLFNSGNNTVIRLYTLSSDLSITNIVYKNFLILEDDYTSKDASYIEGTKSTVSATRIKSVGKNLFHGKIEIGGIKAVDGINYAAADRIRSLKFTKVKPSTRYTLTYVNATRYLFFYDKDYRYIGYALNSTTNIITPDNCYYLKFTYTITDLNLPIQVEEGVVITPYEPYKESTTYINAKDEAGKIIELHSLPNGVRDESSLVDKDCVKRTKTLVLQPNNISNTLSTTTTNVTYAYIIKPLDFSYINSYGGNNAYTLDGYPIATLPLDDVSNIGKTTAGGTLNNFIVIYPLGTTVEQVRADLSGKELTYQLAEPKIYDLDVHGNIESFPNGTMYIDPYIADNFQYGDTGITLPYPVSEVEKVETIVNGKLEEINLATVTLNSDSKTVAITGAAKGKAYKIHAPIKSEESTRGTIKYKAPLNTSATIMDTNALSNSNKKDIDSVKDLTNAYIIQNEYELALTKARLDTIETKINTKP